MNGFNNLQAIPLAQKGAALGVATLDSGGKVPAGQLPVNAGAVNSVNGHTGTVALAASDVGLGNVDNTSDANKPVSTAAAAALALKATLASPTFTGTVVVPTATAGDSSTKAASTAFVAAAVAAYSPANGALVNAKLANMANGTVKARLTSGTGVPEDVTLAALKSALAFTAADLGLNSVQNTSDANKPVSTATLAAIAAFGQMVSGSGYNGLKLGDGTGPGLYWGAAAPETNITAKPGSLYFKTSGGAGATLFVKESGTSNTGWIAK